MSSRLKRIIVSSLVGFATLVGSILLTNLPVAAMEQVLPGGYEDSLSNSSSEYNSVSSGYNWGSVTSSYTQVIPTDGTLGNLQVELDAAVTGTSASYTITLYINGSPSSLATTVSEGQTTGVDADTIDVVAGDYVYLTSSYSNSPTNTPKALWSIKFSGSTSNESILLGVGATSTSNAVYSPACQAAAISVSTENSVYQVVPTDGTIKNLYVKMASDPGTSPDDYYFRLRVNGTDSDDGFGNPLSVTIVADDTTGNDTTHSIDATAGDYIDIKLQPENTPSANPVTGWGMVFVADTNGESLILGQTTDSPSTSATEYYRIPTSLYLFQWSSTESERQSGSQAHTNDAILKKFYMMLDTAPGSGKEWDFTIRGNSGNTDITVNLTGDSQTTANDTSHTFTMTDYGELGIMSEPTNTPATTKTYWGIVCYINPVGAEADISNSPSSKAFGVVAINSTYWSNGSEPTWGTGLSSTKSPTADSGSWTDPTNAYADGSGYAYIESGSPSASHTYDDYGFSLDDNAAITQVRVRYDAWCEGNVGAGSTVTFVRATEGSANSDTLTLNIQVSSGTNRVLVVGLAFENKDPVTPTSVVFNTSENFTAELIAADGGYAQCALYYLVAPTETTADVVVTLPASDVVCGYVAYFTGVNQSEPFTAATTENSGGDANPTVDVSSASDEIVVDIMSQVSAGPDTISSNSGTKILDQAQTQGGDDLRGGGQYDTGQATTTMEYTMSDSDDWNIIGAALQPVSGDTVYDEQIKVYVTWDNGSSWDNTTQTVSGSETTYWWDVTSSTSWTPTKLNDTNLQVKVEALTVGDSSEVYLDWLPVEVTYNDYLSDSEAYFTITNNGEQCSITVEALNFSGGVGWTLTSGAPGENTVRLTVFKEGDGSGDGIVLTTSPQAFILVLGASADIDWELKFETGTFTDPVEKTTTITLIATLD